MQLSDKSTLGLIIWGTKRGKSVFLSFNMAESNEELNSQMDDVQSSISFQRINHEFYSFQVNNQYKTISIINSLNDALNRIGFLAVTLVIPGNKTFKNNRSKELLKKLLQVYTEKYVVADYVTKTINPNVREDISIFENILKQFSYEFVAPDDQWATTARAAKGSCFIKFNDETELDEIFQNYDREQFRQYERVIVLPNVTNDLTANVSFTDLPPVEKKIKLIIRTQDQEGNILTGVSLELRGQRIGQQRLVANPEASVTIPANEQVTISAEKAGYFGMIYTPQDVQNAITVYAAVLQISLRKIEQTKPKFYDGGNTSSTASGGGTKNTNTGNNAQAADQKQKRMLYLVVGLLICLVASLVYIFIFREPDTPPVVAPVQKDFDGAIYSIDTALKTFKAKSSVSVNDSVSIRRFIANVKEKYGNGEGDTSGKYPAKLSLADSLIAKTPVKKEKVVPPVINMEQVKVEEPQDPEKQKIIAANEGALKTYDLAIQKAVREKSKLAFEQAKLELEAWKKNAGNLTDAQKSKYTILKNKPLEPTAKVATQRNYFNEFMVFFNAKDQKQAQTEFKKWYDKAKPIPADQLQKIKSKGSFKFSALKN